MNLEISFSDPLALLAIAIAFALGGVLKGATGAGLPIITVPVIAAFYDVRIAVVMMVVPNFITNVWQMYKFRKNNTHAVFTRKFAIAGIIGAGFGTLLLVRTNVGILNLLMALVIFIYIGMRLIRPSFSISLDAANKLAWLGGGGGGILQGAIGVSAPIAVTFLNAVKLPRPEFILSASTFFAAMCLVQFPLQMASGLIDRDMIVMGFLALIPLFAGLYAGEYTGRKMNAKLFDAVVLIMLALLAFRQVFRFAI